MPTRISPGCGPPARRIWPADPVTTHRLTLDLPYRPEDLFELVSDVARYPDFIGWIQSLRLLSEQEEPGRVRCRAEATVGFKGFRESFITDIDARRSELAIDVSLVRGPFRKLSNSWRFAPTEAGTRVDFSIAFEFRNFVLQALADANKIYAVKRVIDAFIDEAEQRYRKVPPTV
jgi:coenzyme Q-binding protein COQ10